MFDIGFSELVVIAVVALIVIGPERLPKVARTAGILLGRLRRYAADVKADINREIQLEELRQMQQEVHERVMAADAAARRDLTGVEQQLDQALAPPPAEDLTPDAAPPIVAASAEPAVVVNPAIAAVSPAPTFSSVAAASASAEASADAAPIQPAARLGDDANKHS
jgi:sec-independent protein translocase protein TatB